MTSHADPVRLRLLVGLFLVGLFLGGLFLGGLALAPGRAFGFAAPFQTQSIFSAGPDGVAARVITSFRDRAGVSGLVLPEFEAFKRFGTDWELGFDLPFERLREGGSPHFGAGSGGIELDHRLYRQQEGGWLPSIGVAPEILLPSPAAKFGLGTNALHAHLPLILTSKVGAWTTTENVAYAINPGPGNRNYWFVGGILDRALSATVHLGAELYYRSSTGAGLRDTVGFTVGAELKLSDHQAVFASIGRALVHARDTNRVTSYLLYEIKF